MIFYFKHKLFYTTLVVTQNSLNLVKEGVHDILFVPVASIGNTGGGQTGFKSIPYIVQLLIAHSGQLSSFCIVLRSMQFRIIFGKKIFFLCVLFITFSYSTQLFLHRYQGEKVTKPLQRVFDWDPVSSSWRRVPYIVPPQ